MRVEYIPLGGASEVGASCGILRIGDRRLLIDAGMRPSARAGQDRLPALDRLTVEPPEAILVTHAHIDHTGALPLASERFPTAPIYCDFCRDEVKREQNALRAQAYRQRKASYGGVR